MTIRHFTGLAAAGIMLAACQSGSYNIKGRIDGVADGETVYLTTDVYTDRPRPADSATVSGGRFGFGGTADSLCAAMVFCKSRPARNALFIIEPGTIMIHIGNCPDSTRVYGTFCNNKWQRLNDSLLVIGRHIGDIAQYIYGSSLSYGEQQEKIADIKKLEDEFTRIINRTAEQNAGNDFGNFVRHYYGLKP